MSFNIGEWLVDGHIIGFGSAGLPHEPESVVDISDLASPVFSLSSQQEVTMSIQLTNRQVENMWVVYHNLHRKLACCPSKRVYHNAFKHHKARIREKNRKRAERMIERMMKN